MQSGGRIFIGNPGIHFGQNGPGVSGFHLTFQLKPMGTSINLNNVILNLIGDPL